MAMYICELSCVGMSYAVSYCLKRFSHIIDDVMYQDKRDHPHTPLITPPP